MFTDRKNGQHSPESLEHFSTNVSLGDEESFILGNIAGVKFSKNSGRFRTIPQPKLKIISVLNEPTQIDRLLSAQAHAAYTTGWRDGYRVTYVHLTREPILVTVGPYTLAVERNGESPDFLSVIVGSPNVGVVSDKLQGKEVQEIGRALSALKAGRLALPQTS